MFNIAIIIPIYNCLEFTKKCLYSLYVTSDIENLKANISVIVVDDSSIDGSYEWILNNYPQVNLLQGDGNLWWSGGINFGLKYAIDTLKSEYLVWWNNDILPDNNYFSSLLQLLPNYDLNTVIGSKIYSDKNRSLIWSMGGQFNPKTGEKFMVGSGMPDNNNFTSKIEVDWLPGMGTITHRSIYEKIGFIDEKRFPQYHGDSDFTYRAKKSGCKIVVCPELILFNDTSHSGIKHNESFKKLIESLTSLKSNYNFKKDLIFYSQHSKSILAPFILIKKYSRYIGGFYKWKLYMLLGKHRKQ